MNKYFHGLVIMLVCWLTACAANAPQSSNGGPSAGQSGKSMAELVGPDEDVQRRDAINAHLAAGMESLRLRDAERARRHIARSLEIDSGSAEALNAMALYYRLDVDDKREEKYYRKALRADSKFSQARNNYASLLYRQGRYKEAVRQLERAVDDTNYDQRHLASLNLGRCYIKLGEVDKAIDALQRSLRLDSTQTDALLELADAYLGKKNYADARSYITAYAARARQTARSLWVAIRVEQALGGGIDKESANKIAGYELQLDGMFKGTAEHAQWQAWKATQPDRVRSSLQQIPQQGNGKRK